MSTMKALMKLFENVGTKCPGCGMDGELMNEVSVNGESCKQCPQCGVISDERGQAIKAINDSNTVTEGREDDLNSPESLAEIRDELQEIQDEFEDLIRRTNRAVRQLPGVHRQRAEMYWLGHIKAAVDGSQYGFGDHETDLAKTIASLNRMVGGESDE